MIGFETESSVIEIIRVCFDQIIAKSYWAKHIVWANIQGRDTGNDRPSFTPDDFFDFDVNEFYTQV